MGFGTENSLVTSGIVTNAAHCPGGIQNADNVTYNDYNLVLPRLEATVELMLDTTIGSAIIAMDSDTLADEGVQLHAVAYDEEPAAGYNFAEASNTSNLKARTFTITAAQERWQYATQCPEGHMFPADDEEFWGISLNGDEVLD
nr:hypothetical protein [Desulfobacula sp.]